VVDPEILSHGSWFSAKSEDIQMSTFSVYPDRKDDQNLRGDHTLRQPYERSEEESPVMPSQRR
jgi:hypothetical protein